MTPSSTQTASAVTAAHAIHPARVTAREVAASREPRKPARCPAVVPVGRAADARGARAVAQGTVLPAGTVAPRGTGTGTGAPALVDGNVGPAVAPRGRPRIALAVALALTLTVEGERITAYEVIADPVDPHRLDLAVLEE
ncbi:hypothetical protein [Streptomyces sp. NPDC058466]|uniref:hypothetical protein n=1 Tax=Streptomyces sp. NPDC058466 TaxID=3346512 RepID=UPI00364861AF